MPRKRLTKNRLRRLAFKSLTGLQRTVLVEICQGLPPSLLLPRRAALTLKVLENKSLIRWSPADNLWLAHDEQIGREFKAWQRKVVRKNRALRPPPPSAGLPDWFK